MRDLNDDSVCIYMLEAGISRAEETAKENVACVAIWNQNDLAQGRLPAFLIAPWPSTTAQAQAKWCRFAFFWMFLMVDESSWNTSPKLDNQRARCCPNLE